jgi:hypothetical protein
MIPSQGSTAEFAYGLVCGTIIGNFVQRFAMDNGRQPDKDETADLFSIMIRNMPSIRKSVLNELKPSE